MPYTEKITSSLYYAFTMPCIVPGNTMHTIIVCRRHQMHVPPDRCYPVLQWKADSSHIAENTNKSGIFINAQFQINDNEVQAFSILANPINPKNCTAWILKLTNYVTPGLKMKKMGLHAFHTIFVKFFHSKRCIF